MTITPMLERRTTIEDFFKYAVINLNETREIIDIAERAKGAGLKTKDALHLACAVVAKCDYLLTTDKRLLKHKDNKIQLLNPMQFLVEMEGM